MRLAKFSEIIMQKALLFMKHQLKKYFRILAGGIIPKVQRVGFERNYGRFFASCKKGEGLPKSDCVDTGVIVGGIVPHHYPFTEAFYPTFFYHVGKLRPSTIVILGPDHDGKGKATVTVSNSLWLTPFGTLLPDDFIIESITKMNWCVIDAGVHAHEWSVRGLLPYIKLLFPSVRVVPILLRPDTTLESAATFGRGLSKLLGVGSLCILSADFAHGFSAEKTSVVDDRSRAVISRVDIESIKNVNIDTPMGLVVLFSVLGGVGAMTPIMLDYATSGSLHRQDPNFFPVYPYLVSYFSYVFVRDNLRS